MLFECHNHNSMKEKEEKNLLSSSYGSSRDVFSELNDIDEEFRSEFADSLHLTQMYLTDEVERIQTDLKYTLNKRVK